MNVSEVAGKPCDMCGQGVYVIKRVQEPVTVQGTMTYVPIIVAECSRCGEHVYDDEAGRALQSAYARLATTA